MSDVFIKMFSDLTKYIASKSSKGTPEEIDRALRDKKKDIELIYTNLKIPGVLRNKMKEKNTEYYQFIIRSMEREGINKKYSGAVIYLDIANKLNVSPSPFHTVAAIHMGSELILRALEEFK